MSADQFIAARVSSETKSQLRALAQRQQLSESALLKRLLETTLQVDDNRCPADSDQPLQGTRGARLYVRLRPVDQLLLAERAAARGMAAATYVSVLVRAHLRGLAPLPHEELLALKRSVAELGAIGRNLNQSVRAAGAAVGLERVYMMVKVCEAMRDHVKALTKANTVSWQVGYAQSKPCRTPVRFPQLRPTGA
ncbi:MAG: hypothetical protein ACLQFT_07935 [Steroidobacteraceae bacterium]|jgi:hypothetical protein